MKTENKKTKRNESGLSEALAVIIFIYFIASVILRA